jgi:hypothetical protein
MVEGGAMTEHRSAASLRARLPRSAGRALLLTGVGAGLWLLGSHGATASADELAPAPAPVASGLLAPVADALPPVVDHLVTPVAERVLARVVADVAEEVVEDVEEVAVPAVEEVVVQEVEDIVAPVVEPVVEDVVVPVVAPVVEPVVQDVVDPVTVSVVVPIGAAAALGVADQLTQIAAPIDAPPPSPATRGVPPVVLSAGSQVGPAALPATTPLPTAPAGPAGVPGAAPAPSAPSGSWSADQTPADLSPAAQAMAGAALRPAAGARFGATGGGTFDPSFSPD